MAGVTWLISLLNPASAFVKACKAIYDVIMFFVERGEQIMALVNTIIDSVTQIASGALGGVAGMIEGVLAKGPAPGDQLRPACSAWAASPARSSRSSRRSRAR